MKEVKCKKCGVFVQKGKIREHRKNGNCDPEARKHDREIMEKISGIVNKIVFGG